MAHPPKLNNDPTPQEILENSPDAILVTSQEGEILSWNRGAEMIFGFSSKEVIGKSIYDLIIPDDRKKETQEAIQSALEGRSVAYESVGCRKDTSLLAMDISKAIIRNSQGRPDRVVTVQKDITSIALQRERRIFEAKFCGLLELAPDATLIADRQGRIRLINSRTEKLFEYSREELIGRSIEILIPERFRGGRLPDRTGYFDDPKICSIWNNPALCGLRKSGGELPVEISLNQLEKEGSAMIAIRDMTERRRTEEELTKLNAQLEASNKELEAFSYSVSHDLRAPLRHIQGFVQLLKGHEGSRLDAAELRYVDTITNSAKRMGDLIDDLLVFSRIGKSEMRIGEVDLALLTQEVIQDFKTELEGREVAWKIGVLPTVYADRAMLRQVWTNLIDNAVKYSRPRARAEIEIGGKQDEKETIFFIRDNGVGFNPEYTDKLFGVFQRLHRADEFEGTGIGLANVRRIVSRHAGRTWAEGRLDAGAVFYFSLPNREEKHE